MTSTELLAGICHALPPRLGTFVYHRIICHCTMGESFYQQAPLRFAPGFKMNLMPRDVCHGSIAFTGCYELLLTRRICEIAHQEGGTLIDAGANYGYYSLLWTAARPDNRVIAFDASPRNFPALIANTSMNRVADRIDSRNKALGDKTGSVYFKMSAENQSGWDKITEDVNDSNWTIPLTTLDVELEDRNYSALKIDCEGYDYHVVQGTRSLLEKRRFRHVFFEENIGCAESFGIAAGEVGKLLRDLGYHVKSLGNSSEYEAFLR